MMYEPVLKFGADTLADFDAMVALEDRLIEDLGHSANVDGHDCGSGETNISIFTSDPSATFSRVRQTLQRERRLQSVTATYRPFDGGQFTVLWPEGSQTEFTVA